MMVPSCSAIVQAARTLADNIVLFMPRNSDAAQLLAMAGALGPGVPAELEQNLLNGKLKTLTAYYGHDLCG